VRVNDTVLLRGYQAGGTTDGLGYSVRSLEVSGSGKRRPLLPVDTPLIKEVSGGGARAGRAGALLYVTPTSMSLASD
jgi:hypothetical protein